MSEQENVNRGSESASRRVVVGVDGSEYAERALDWAQEYARLTSAPLRVVVAWDSVVGYGRAVVVPAEDMRRSAVEVMEQAAKAITLPDEQVETRIVRGHTGEALSAESRDAALLVVGSKGHNPLATMLLGSVSGYVVHHAASPVVVVK